MASYLIEYFFYFSLAIFCILLVLVVIYFKDKVSNLDKQVSSLRDILGKLIVEIKGINIEPSPQYKFKKLDTITEVKCEDYEECSIDDDEDDDDEEEHSSLTKTSNIHLQYEEYEMSNDDEEEDSKFLDISEEDMAKFFKNKVVPFNEELDIETFDIEDNVELIEPNADAEPNVSSQNDEPNVSSQNDEPNVELNCMQMTNDEEPASNEEQIAETVVEEKVDIEVESDEETEETQVVEALYEPELVEYVSKEVKIESFRKMNLPQLKQYVLSKGLAIYTNKLKKDELLKLIIDSLH